ncbi:chemotaxis protein CheB [Roseomonas marmotae]|uniref:chemotaxis protein CheB n=1 Tax=Roseomonas marmotae TaxID=2768161 RepID=UPI003AF7383F
MLCSAAAERFGKQAIGVILSGDIDDGVASIRDIKASGRLSLVQAALTAMTKKYSQCC